MPEDIQGIIQESTQMTNGHKLESEPEPVVVAPPLRHLLAIQIIEEEKPLQHRLQLAGDILWFICEIVDLPLIILMFMCFSRCDKREARGFADLTDQELDELNEQHLRRGR